MAKDRIHLIHSFEHDPYDVATAFKRVTEEMFGADQFIGIKQRFWLPSVPVSFTSVNVGVSQEVKVIMGSFRVKAIDGDFNLEESTLQAIVNKSEVKKVEDFLAKVKKSLEISSIYRGKALTSAREFMDLSAINPDLLVYNSRILRELKENLWVLIEKKEECKAAGAQIQRKVLFEGKYGTGKTMALLATAKKAVENGFTFIYLEPTLADVSGIINRMLKLCQKYQPSILAIEDFDREQRVGDVFAVGRLMTAIDGVLSKDAETIIILTTNFKDKIAGGFKRPGRIDKTINFNIFESEDAARLLQIVIPVHFQSLSIDWSVVGKAASHMTPAFIKEVGTGSKLAAISRAGKGKNPMVTQEILLNVIEGLQDQHKACEEQFGFSK